MVIDVLPEYMQYGMENLRQNSPEGYDPIHPNAKGHGIMAERIFNKIKEYVEYSR
ncbi:MAG: hypothetical protein WC916_05185 [Candidatus Woesearchaeota archaeon]